MIAASGAARSEDISTLGRTIFIYINEADPDHKVHPEISAKLKKSKTRGFKHPVLARLLCPIKHLEDFDANPTEYSVYSYPYVMFSYLLFLHTDSCANSIMETYWLVRETCQHLPGLATSTILRIQTLIFSVTRFF